jgi:hypothetical protein
MLIHGGCFKLYLSKKQKQELNIIHGYLFVGATTLEFDGAQFLKITMEDASATEAEDISLRFRTTRKNGLLLITSSDHSPDKIELYLEAGSVKFDIKIGQSSKVFISYWK